LKKAAGPNSSTPRNAPPFLVPDSISSPNPENSFNTTTEWPRECFKPTVMGVSYKHCFHCNHPNQSGTHPGLEKLEQEAADYGFVEVISRRDGLFLGGVKLDPASSFYSVVAAITIGV
jgi:hypothetical protein